MDFHFTETFSLFNLHVKHGRELCVSAGQRRVSYYWLTLIRSPPALAADWFVSGWAGRTLLGAAIRCLKWVLMPSTPEVHQPRGCRKTQGSQPACHLTTELLDLFITLDRSLDLSCCNTSTNKGNSKNSFLICICRSKWASATGTLFLIKTLQQKSPWSQTLSWWFIISSISIVIILAAIWNPKK